VSSAEVIFAALAGLAVASGLLSVTSRHVVHAALWLVVALGSLAGVYLVLGAEVVALVQLLVYVGAVVVLVLFDLMLTRAPIGVRDDLDAPAGRRAGATLAGVCLAALIGGTLMAAVGDARIAPDAALGTAKPVAVALFGSWLLPFELLSVLLVAALVAALAISGEDRRGDEPGEP
jgi:NADH-quinone oxidoreductase subunit J